MREDVKIVQAMIDLMVGIPKFSYPARQNGAPKPEGEFAHIRLLEEYPVMIPSQAIHIQTDIETTYRSTSVAKLRFRIGVVDTDGIPSSKIMHGWTSEGMKSLMIESGYGFIKCHPLSTEDSLLEKEWELRQGFSLELYVTRTFEEVVNNITSVVVTGEFISAPYFTTDLIMNINN
jgi:hypothetical protein